jgi:hypothetical protein
LFGVAVPVTSSTTPATGTAAQAAAAKLAAKPKTNPTGL